MDAGDAAKVAKTATVLGHVRDNHISYLLGILALHSMGLLTTAQETVGGCI